MTLTKVIMTEWLKNCCSNFEFVVEQKFMSHWMSRQSMHCFGGKKCMKFDIEVLWRVEKQEQQTALWKNRETLKKKNCLTEVSSKWTILGIFNELLATQKCKRSSLRSQCWMRLFRRFSNTVGEAGKIVLHTEPNDWPSTFNWCHFQSELKFHALFHSPIHFVPFHLDQFLRCKTHCDKQIIFLNFSKHSDIKKIQKKNIAKKRQKIAKKMPNIRTKKKNIKKN